MNKYIRKRKRNQDWQKKDIWPADEITQNREQFFRSLHPTKIQLLEIFLSLHYKNHGNIFINQENLAKMLGISREWANKLLLWFEERGIILANYIHMYVNQYKLSSWFNNPIVRSALRPIFKAIQRAILISLVSNPASADNSQSLFTHIKVRNLYLFKKRKHSDKHIRYSHSTERIVMESPFSIAIREIKSLSLTEAGMCTLSAFPDDAIRYVDKTINLRNVRNHFGLFYTKCKQYCIDNHLTPNWDYQFQLTKRLGISMHTPMLKEAKEIKAPETVAHKTQKEESRQQYPEWKGPERRRYPPAKPQYIVANNARPEQEEIAKNYFNKQTEVYERYQSNKNKVDAQRNFLPGCQLDHQKEFEVFFSPAGVENLHKQCMLLGEKVAKDLFKNMIDQHEHCLKTNHGAQNGIIFKRM